MRLTHAAKDLAALHPRRAYWHTAANNTNRHKWSMMDLEALKSDLMARIDAAGDAAALERLRRLLGRGLVSARVPERKQRELHAHSAHLQDAGLTLGISK